MQLQELHAFEAGDGFCFVHPHVGYRYVSIDAPYFYSVGGEVICGESVGDSDEGYCRFGDCIVLESGNGIEGLFVVPWVFRNRRIVRFALLDSGKAFISLYCLISDRLRKSRLWEKAGAAAITSNENRRLGCFTVINIEG